MKNTGFYNKYQISRTDGTPMNFENEYFILKIAGEGDDFHINACRKALMTYADEIEPHLPELSKDLRQKYGEMQKIRGNDYIPFTSDDAIQFLGKIVKEIDTQKLHIILAYDEDYIILRSGYSRYKEAFKNYIFIDDSPFGKKIDGNIEVEEDKGFAYWIFYEDELNFYCVDCLQKRLETINQNKEFSEFINYDQGEECGYYEDWADTGGEYEATCCVCDKPLLTLEYDEGDEV